MKKTNQPPVRCKVSWVCTNRGEEANSRRENYKESPVAPTVRLQPGPLDPARFLAAS